MLDYLVDYKRERGLFGKQVRSIRSFGVNKVLYVSKRGIDFKLYVLVWEAPLVGKAYIGN